MPNFTQSATSARQASDLAGAFDVFIKASQALEQQYAALTQQVDALSADLVQANARLNVLLNAQPAAVILIEDSLISHFNSAASHLIPELKTQTPWTLPVDWIQGQGPDEYQFKQDQQVRTLQLQRVDNGPRSVIQIQDITANLRMLEESERVDRLAAMGKMSAGIAHQLRTPLSTALLYASHLCNAELTTDDRVNFANRLQQQLINLEKLASQMLQFIRARPQQTQIVALHDLVRDACMNLEALSQQRQVRMEADLQSPDCMVSVERPSMVSALVAILENSLQACSPGQRIFIHTKCDQLRALITIEDTGPGIASDMISRLFEPFATDQANGTGLGLAIARDAIRSHRGEISAHNLPIGGAQFRVSLPCLPPL